jgi:hypothetical protein
MEHNPETPEDLIEENFEAVPEEPVMEALESRTMMSAAPVDADIPSADDNAPRTVVTQTLRGVSHGVNTVVSTVATGRGGIFTGNRGGLDRLND